MSRREAAFLLLGLGIGLMFAVAAVAGFALSFHHMFIVGIRLTPASVVLALSGLLILYSSGGRRTLN
jgi:hypothetical protein